MTVIDVNSGRYAAKKNKNEFAPPNLEASRRNLQAASPARYRWSVVVDFIDLEMRRTRKKSTMK